MVIKLENLNREREEWIELIIKKCGRNCKYVNLFLKNKNGKNK